MTLVWVQTTWQAENTIPVTFVRWWEQTLHFHCNDGSLCPLDTSLYTIVTLRSVRWALTWSPAVLAAACSTANVESTPWLRPHPFPAEKLMLLAQIPDRMLSHLLLSAAPHEHATLTFAAAFSLVPLCWLESCTWPAMSCVSPDISWSLCLQASCPIAVRPNCNWTSTSQRSLETRPLS